jgi:dTDP-4-dehydrorhamnose reductase
MKFLIAGKNGQLAQAFVRTFDRRSLEYLAPDEKDLDITDFGKIDGIVASFRPDVIINCAAYNLVDKAEQEKEKAFLVNATGPQLLARAARKHGAQLVHYSSDYVFDGRKESGLYREGDETGPLNEYGKSKLKGEQLVREETSGHLIFRLSWVFGDGKQNFVHKLAEWARSSEYLKIACDEFSVPTYTHTIADVTLKALEQGVSGLHHLTNSGFCSRYEWARLVLSVLGISKFIRPVSMDSFNLPAKRPKFSAMSNEQIARLLGIRIPEWSEAVSTFLHERKDVHE